MRGAGSGGSRGSSAHLAREQLRRDCDEDDAGAEPERLARSRSRRRADRRPRSAAGISTSDPIASQAETRESTSFGTCACSEVSQKTEKSSIPIPASNVAAAIAGHGASIASSTSGGKQQRDRDDADEQRSLGTDPERRSGRRSRARPRGREHEPPDRGAAERLLGDHRAEDVHSRSRRRVREREAERRRPRSRCACGTPASRRRARGRSSCRPREPGPARASAAGSPPRRGRSVRRSRSPSPAPPPRRAGRRARRRRCSSRSAPAGAARSPAGGRRRAPSGARSPAGPGRRTSWRRPVAKAIAASSQISARPR